MSRRYKVHWLIWLGATCLFALGMWTHNLSSTANEIPIRLSPGVSVTVNEFRLFNGTGFGGSLKFEDTPHLRATAGTSSYRGDWRKTGYIEYPNPGVPVAVRVLVDGNSSAVVLHAKPNFVAQGVIRVLSTSAPTPVSDGRRFPWPPPPMPELSLSMGSSRIIVEVVEVGPSLMDRSAVLVVSPPVDFAFLSNHPGYKLLWVFYLWPIFGVFLAIWAVALYVVRHRWT
jgi:hypothetical protein